MHIFLQVENVQVIIKVTLIIDMDGR